MTRMITRTLIAVLAVAIALAATAATTRAEGSCTEGADHCLIVNTNEDTDARDGALSLREALLLDNGSLALSQLDAGESAQVIVAGQGVLGSGGISYIYFDPNVFCEGCSSNTIVLAPPGFGGPASVIPVGGRKTRSDGSIQSEPPAFGGASLPPAFGGASEGTSSLISSAVVSAPPGFGGPASARLGMSVGAGEEGPATVVIDGSQLPVEIAGLEVSGAEGWIRGMHFQNFPGTAIAILDDLAAATLIGSNLDGENDVEEAVTFANNGQDIGLIE